jgi:hypothetical protein
MSGAPYIRNHHAYKDFWDIAASGELIHPGNMYGSPCLTTYDSLHPYYADYQPVHQLGFVIGDVPHPPATGPVMPPAKYHLSQQAATTQQGCGLCQGAPPSPYNYTAMW